MGLKGVIATTCICFIIFISIAGQEKKQISKNDTVPEIIIYEYDTVYVAPDTLKQTDTIIHYKLKKTDGSQKTSDFLKNLNVLKSLSERWSLGAGVQTLITGLFNDSYEVDSFARKRTINLAFELHVNYQDQFLKYSLGIGFLPYHEQLQYQGTRFVNSSGSSNGYYDSLRINSNGITDNYYQYLTVFFNLGKKWGKRTVFVALNGYILTNILINSSALMPTNPPLNINSSLIQKIGYQVGINPCIGFKVRKQFDLSIGPFCNYAFSNEKKHPSIDQLIMGISFKIQ